MRSQSLSWEGGGLGKMLIIHGLHSSHRHGREEPCKTDNKNLLLLHQAMTAEYIVTAGITGAQHWLSIPVGTASV
jgi:hypothetical protein